MSQPVPPTAPSFRLRLMRPAVSAFFALGKLTRRPPKAPAGVVEHRYGEDPAERIEYIAPKPGAPSRAAVVYIHGGGWVLGKKESYSPFLSFLAEAGYPVFNVEYPLAPEHPHPELLRSLFSALDWIAAEHPEVERYHVMGDSAGGNLAMMVGLFAHNPNLLDAVAPERESLPLQCQTVVSLYGVLDRLSWIEDGFPGADMMMESYAGKASFEKEVGPEIAITPMDLDFETAPPTLLTVGTEDQLLRSSRIFAERLGAGVGKVRLIEYPGEGHGFFNFGKTKSDQQMNADILDFLAAEDPGNP